MNKTSTTWIIASLCMIIVLTAFGVLTHRMVSRDIKQSQQIVDANREGRIRLAMWRLDTLGASIITNEDNRSVYEFKNPELESIQNSGVKNTINPLYFETPKTTRLYWNIDPNINDKINSPQVYRQEYLTQNSININNNLNNTQQLVELKDILHSDIDKQAAIILPNSNNISLSCAAAHISLDRWAETQKPKIAPNVKNDFSYNSYSKNTISNTQVDASLNNRAMQTQLTKADKSSRSKAINRMSNYSRKAEWSQNLKKSKQTSQESSSKKIPQAQLKNFAPELLLLKDKPEDTTSISQTQNKSFSTPFNSLWLKGELMLVRKATYLDKDSVQGVWLNKDVLIKKLLSEIHDLFPNAKLIPAKQDIAGLLMGKKNKGDETTMLSIPLRLIHNDLAVVSATSADYINGPIGLAWLGAILAITASYFMLKSVLTMAERRASFVSSVTHELRTPLTTFRLYSDLLSSGMVTDEEKQKSYLNTLKHESERLTHLVENVLSYSQIERGNAKAKVETVSLYQFIQRIEPRLNERAQEDEMFVNTVFSYNSSDKSLQIDITAVEQIIFNLVDNACKYASSENHGKEITLLAEVKNKKINIQICDQGDGIARSEQRRLFKPFHKSAKEAAHTKPGVGLGLALCKRLAKAMRGDLTIVRKSKSKGACFQLSLPI